MYRKKLHRKILQLKQIQKFNFQKSNTMGNKTAVKYKSAKDGLLGGLIDLKSMQEEFPKAAAVVGGIVIGKFVNGMLDKIIMSKTVAGFMGVELQANVAKWLKPALVGIAGFGLMTYGKKEHSAIMQNIGLGVAGYGISGVFSALTAKNLLQGLGAAEDEYVMLDTNGNRIGTIDMKQLLPDLETPEYSGIAGQNVEYAIMDGTAELPLTLLDGAEDEDEDTPMIMNGNELPLIID